MYSLRRALALRFTITMFAALLLIALWLYWGADRVIRDQLDRALETTLLLHTTELAHQGRIDSTRFNSDFDGFVEVVNRFVVLRNDDGDVLDLNTNLARALPISPEGFGRAMDGDTAWVTQVWGGRAIRTLYAPAPAGSPPEAATLQVTAALDPISRSERRILLLSLGTAVLGSLATAMGAAWLAREASDPVLEIAAQAEAIRDANEGRITVHGDVQEYEQLIHVLNSMLERLRDAYRAQQRMIADIGHDLRTPITALHGAIEVALRNERTTEQYRHTLHSVLEDADTLDAICDSLIVLATVEGGDDPPIRLTVDLADLVRAAYNEQAPRTSDHSITTVEAVTSKTEVLGDEKMLKRLVSELVQNAVHHTPAGTNITLALREFDGMIELRVEDDGPGIPPDALPHIFERLYRVDPARSGPRAGLGLTLVRAVAHVHGGSAEAYSPTDGGFCVRVVLPLASSFASTA